METPARRIHNLTTIAQMPWEMPNVTAQAYTRFCSGRIRASRGAALEMIE